MLFEDEQEEALVGPAMLGPDGQLLLQHAGDGDGTEVGPAVRGLEFTGLGFRAWRQCLMSCFCVVVRDGMAGLRLPCPCGSIPDRPHWLKLV